MVSNIYNSNIPLYKAGSRKGKSIKEIEAENKRYFDYHTKKHKTNNKLNLTKMALTKEQFEEELKVVYDNLTLQQFELLIKTASSKIQQLISSGDLQLDYISKKFDGIDEHKVLSANVCMSVKQIRKISFKQFKSLSWFSGINWIETKKVEETEFKQF